MHLNKTIRQLFMNRGSNYTNINPSLHKGWQFCLAPFKMLEFTDFHIFLYLSMTTKNQKKIYRGGHGSPFGGRSEMNSADENPHIWQFIKITGTYITKKIILVVHSKFQLNRTIIALVTAFQRKSIILFGTAAVTLKTVQIDIGWAQCESNK